MVEHLWVFHHVGLFYFACRGIQGPGVHKVRDQLRGSCRLSRDEAKALFFVFLAFFEISLTFARRRGPFF